MAAAFELEDQFKKTHSIAFPRERACVLLFADRDGSGQIDGWVRALYEQFKDSVDIHGVAQLKGVPPAMRPMIRYVFRQRVSHPVMLDWDGAATGKYACKPGQASVFVIGPDGTISCTAYGAAQGEELSNVTRATESLLRPPAPEKK